MYNFFLPAFILSVCRIITAYVCIMLSLRVSVSEVFERNVFNVMNKILMARMNGELFQDLNQEETEDELNRQITLLRHKLQVWAHPDQITRKKIEEA